MVLNVAVFFVLLSNRVESKQFGESKSMSFPTFKRCIYVLFLI